MRIGGVGRLGACYLRVLCLTLTMLDPDGWGWERLLSLVVYLLLSAASCCSPARLSVSPTPRVIVCSVVGLLSWRTMGPLSAAAAVLPSSAFSGVLIVIASGSTEVGR